MCIFFKSFGFNDIKYDIPVCHEGHKGHECHEDISAYLHFSVFHLISLHFKTHCVQNNVQASLPEGMCDDDI